MPLDCHNANVLQNIQSKAEASITQKRVGIVNSTETNTYVTNTLKQGIFFFIPRFCTTSCGKRKSTNITHKEMKSNATLVLVYIRIYDIQ